MNKSQNKHSGKNNNDKPAFDTYDKAVTFTFRAKVNKKAKWEELRTERMNYFLEKLGSPHEKIKVVHVTGTAGKGSTSVMIAKILQEADYKVGLITSPHLQTVRERIQLNGENVTKEQYLQIMNRVKKAYDAVAERGSYGPPDFQQIHIASALWWFVKQKADIAVVEVGMGGYGDATNCVEPYVSIVTNVGIDHTYALGDTIESVARLKSGIIKKGAVAITGAKQPSVISIIKKRCDHLGVRMRTIQDSAEYRVNSIKPEYVTANIKTKIFNLQGVKIKLTGQYQVRNATLAILAAGILKKRFGFRRINEAAIRQGLENASIQGRFEVVSHNPLVILDSAHNQDKINALVSLLVKLFKGQGIRFVLGFKEGKDYKVCLEALAQLKPKKVYITSFKQRAIHPEDVKKIALEAKKRFSKIEEFQSEKECLKTAMRETEEGEVLIITGSMYMIGSLRHKWEKMD